ncbi:tRNA(adenine34) deaminase [Gordonia malaquae]|uniref:tRNA-specific adenosine deaminase n=1 Tax=Gordonia malaquae NBRC 108250 TaxID=1223542 RepID=M3TD79_GORML|nr:nucleoside deaminase [Gordonia malaquae]GAC79376.1 tRNA-specific adenosine deaminase [Gordonia malaquae NBRC 108250]SEE30740.1 tRNA(adenine34) deaminase [Gordonia malaquae]
MTPDRGAVQRDAERMMRLALDAAHHAGPDDVPIGAVVVGPDGSVLASAANRREADGDPTAHAEVLALREATRRHGDGWRLEDCTLAVTVEPCTMCAGAIGLARVSRVVFGAWEPKTGAVGSLWDVLRDPRLVHRPEVLGGVLEAECAVLVTDFFAARR